MSWEDQGRQEHGWFGNGTAPGGKAVASGDPLFGPEQLGERAMDAVHSTVATLPRELRSQGVTAQGPDAKARLQGLLVRWSRASRLGDAAFAGHFFGRSADDRVVRALRSAAQAVAGARNHDDLREAAEQVAVAMQAVGFGNWGRFLADAQARAEEPGTVAAVADSQRPPAPPARPVAAPVVATPVAPKPMAAPAPVDPGPPAPAEPAVAAEPEHGKVWEELHKLGLVETRHEKAVRFRKALSGPEGELLLKQVGIDLDLDQMSDDDVLALKTRLELEILAPLVFGGMVKPVMTSWGWNSTPAYREAIKELERPGTHNMLNGRVPTREEAIRMIEDSGGTVEGIEKGHPPGRSTHNDPHINYYVKKEGSDKGEKATVL